MVIAAVPEASEVVSVVAGAVLWTVYTTDTAVVNNCRCRTLITVTLTMVTELPVGNNDFTADANAVRKSAESLVTPATVCVACTVTTGASTATGANEGFNEGSALGVTVGETVVGTAVGEYVGWVGPTVGAYVGCVGSREGE